MNHSISINASQQINLFDFNGDHADQFQPTLTYLQQRIVDALEDAGSAGLTTQQLEQYAGATSSEIDRLRKKGVNIMSIKRGPVYEPSMNRVLRNTVKYVLGSPRFINTKPAATRH